MRAANRQPFLFVEKKRELYGIYTCERKRWTGYLYCCHRSSDGQLVGESEGDEK